MTAAIILLVIFAAGVAVGIRNAAPRLREEEWRAAYRTGYDASTRDQLTATHYVPRLSAADTQPIKP